MTPLPARRTVLKAGAAAAAVLLAGCTSDPGRPAPSATTPASPTASPEDTTFTMGIAATPVTLDPALALDTESYRVTRQMLETLIGVDPATGVPAPRLAVEWNEVNDGRSYRFRLREGVTFHDGTPFDADAVHTNFERWYHLPEESQPVEGGLAFRSVFGALASDEAESLYESCEVVGPLEVQLNLTRRFTGLVASLAMPAFAISSPAALKAGKADRLSEERNGNKVSRYGLAPVGTGPFAFANWDQDRVALSAYDGYWGAAGDVRTVVFKTLPHPSARLRALAAGDIDGYDLVTPDTYADLVRAGMQVLQRDPFSVAYLGMNQAADGLKDIRMRQAIAHAVDRKTLIDSFYLQGTTEAKQFIPRSLGVNNETIPYYEYDPDRARELLAAAGYDGGELTFYYPLDVTRAYLPTPEKVYAELSRQLTAVGINIKPMPVPWDEGYLEAVQGTDDHALHLAGISGSYRDPDNFVGPLFGSKTPEFGYDSAQIRSKIARAKTLPEGEDRVDAYLSINEQLARAVPAVPLAFPISALAMGPRVESYPASPMLDEVYNLIQLGPA
ncbi:ABC transporter substrate-binding protein [Arthrobacter sulfonylureivorans]|uniref:ABC transporter substrate-binding protein n=1 Tax=Arthrobacter sulfonylureivorans TaxID=2486855 RepID=UPI0039E619C0